MRVGEWRRRDRGHELGGRSERAEDVGRGPRLTPSSENGTRTGRPGVVLLKPTEPREGVRRRTRVDAGGQLVV